MRATWCAVLGVGLAAIFAACGNDPQDAPVTTPDAAVPDAATADASEGGSGFAWPVPAGFPLPPVPADNPMSEAKVDLGHHLFYDQRLSSDGTYACATCHEQARAFTDGRAQSLGVTGLLHPRGAPSLANVGYMATLTWNNPLISSLEKQAFLPMFGDNPPELGLAGKEVALLARLRDDPKTLSRFAAAFPDASEPVSIDTITKALAAFERTIISGRSGYDRYVIDRDPTALSDAAKRGMSVFFSESGDCYHCHGGFTFSDSVVRADSPFVEATFHNTGLYNVDGNGGYPKTNTGIYEITGKPGDMGKFRAPSLRNVELTAPYMHDGSVATLEDVVQLYIDGGRNVTSGPNAGDGRTNPFKDSLVRPLPLTANDRADLVEFLKSLTDHDLLTNPRFGPPGD